MTYVWCAVFTVVGFVLGAIFAVVGLVLLPANYFVRSPDEHSLSLPWRIVKNIVGVVLVALGIVMLVMPGQGLLTIVVGLMLVDFPGKHEWVKKILDRPRLLESANRLRARFGKPPLVSG